jgi:triacylglycerol esterase/lipase EstA (alpha/beta hydrolase family)
VHGIARTDRVRHEDAWGRIPQVFRENGIEVYFGHTDAWGDISSNAELLKAAIDSILENSSHEKVNIIAHSKGGIDSRYFIWKYDYGDRVASLTTISTPHGGSEIADFIYRSGIIHSESTRSRLQDIGRIFGDVNPDMFNVNQNLTTGNMREFNTTVTKDPRVFYQVFYSVMNDSADDSVYSLSYSFLRTISGANDGLVSARSASWGNNPIRLPMSLSHRQMTDQGTEGFSDMVISDIYLDIVRELVRQGF